MEIPERLNPVVLATILILPAGLTFPPSQSYICKMEILDVTPTQAAPGQTFELTITVLADFATGRGSSVTVRTDLIDPSGSTVSVEGATGLYNPTGDPQLLNITHRLTAPSNVGVWALTIVARCITTIGGGAGVVSTIQSFATVQVGTPRTDTLLMLPA